MFERAPFLGQVPIRSGAGFFSESPWGVASGVPGGGPPPPGFPSASEEIATPGGEETEAHCYECSDGQVRFLTIDQRRAMESVPGGLRCTALIPSSDPRCAGGPPLSPGRYGSALPGAAYAEGAPVGMYGMGQAKGGSAPSSGGGGSSVSVSPMTVGTTPSENFFAPDFGWPYYYPQPPRQGRLVCRKRITEAGEETFICEPEAPVYNYPVIRYPTFFFRSFF